MQVVVDVNGMQIKFGEHDLSGLGDFTHFACLQNWPNFPFRPWAIIVHEGQKI